MFSAPSIHNFSGIKYFPVNDYSISIDYIVRNKARATKYVYSVVSERFRYEN